MRIGIISDSHGNRLALKTALVALGTLDILIHLGDHSDDLDNISGLPREVYVVRGNTDTALDCPEEVQLEFEGKRLLLCHGHRHGVKSDLQRLYYHGLESNAQFVLFGHTHQSVIVEEEGVVLINPGSTSRPYPGYRPSAALLNLDSDGWRVQIVYL